MFSPGVLPLSLKQVLDPVYLANPYHLYRQLRAHDPVYWDEAMQAWVLTRYEEVQAVLRDPRCSKEHFPADVSQFPEPMREQGATILHILSRQMLFLDAPDHTRLRRLVSQAFTPRRIALMRASIQALVNRLLDAVQGKEQMDVIAEVAFPLPSIVIAEMLGVPSEDREQFAIWTTAFGALLDGTAHTPTERAQALRGIAAFLSYFRRLIAQRHVHPQDDLIQALLDAKEQDDTLREEEVLANSFLLLAAGHGTTIHAIGNGLLALLQHPDQLQILRSDPTLLPAAIEELLRYDGPVQTTRRIAREPMEIGGKHIAAGQALIACLGAANHDPERFVKPDQLDVRRTASRHLAFGHGSHFCLGAPLARLEIEIALASLLERFPALCLATTEPQWRPTIIFRVLKELPVVIS
ncbi:MAG: cytochrome P450 [Ktedonobacteraceae bacterium]|nr:cytochrome P450 [Ktedonobacteraceae bacterium]